MVFITAEIGINHNGDIDIAKKLIDVASNAGCNAVKFQKRTIEKVYSKYTDMYTVIYNLMKLAVRNCLLLSF